MAMTSIAAAAFLLLTLSLVFDLLGGISREIKTAAALAILLSAPEFFYLKTGPSPAW